MRSRIILGIAAVFIAFLVFVALQPKDFHVIRSTAISAPATAIFPEVNDLHRWDAWSPWAKLDPAMKTTHEGAPAGEGAIYSWSGNSDVGEGRMTITESRPSDLVRLKLEFLRPFKATNTTEFTFKTEGNKTLVTWTMSGEKNFISKAVCVFMDMDKVVGGDFEKGLAGLKTVVETKDRKS